MVSIGTLCTPLSNKSICFHKNHSCLKNPDQPSNHQLPLSSPVSAQSCQSMSTPALMPPNSRKRKSRIANEICDFINLYQLMDDDNVEILSLALKKLNLLDRLTFIKKPSKAGRKMIPHQIRRKIWHFWHTNSMAFTLTSKPAKLRVSNRNKIQNRLEFVDSVSIVQQRNRKFFLSQLFIINITIKELLLKYIKSNPEVPVSLGTFLALKPFYVCSATTKDIEMCCCKKHLHAHWSIQALIQCATNQ